MLRRKREHKLYFVLSLVDEILIILVVMTLMYVLNLLNVQYIILLTLILTLLIISKYKLYPFHPPLTGKEAMIGSTCVAVTTLSPSGTVKYNGELWNARCVDGLVKAGEKVRIVGMDGLTLIVEKMLD
jgi:membrane-bound serine protease (ClpP class)